MFCGEIRKWLFGHVSYLELGCKAYFLIVRLMLAWVMPHLYTLSRSVWSENIWTAYSWNTQCLTSPSSMLAILFPVCARPCSQPECLGRISVRLVIGGSRSQTLPGRATFLLEDWIWNIFYGHFLPSADSRKAVVSFWRKTVHKYRLTA